jgi:hypothetical protein
MLKMTTLTPEQTALLERMRTSFADKNSNGMEMNDQTLLRYLRARYFVAFLHTVVLCLFC